MSSGTLVITEAKVDLGDPFSSNGTIVWMSQVQRDSIDSIQDLILEHRRLLEETQNNLLTSIKPKRSKRVKPAIQEPQQEDQQETQPENQHENQQEQSSNKEENTKQNTNQNIDKNKIVNELDHPHIDRDKENSALRDVSQLLNDDDASTFLD